MVKKDAVVSFFIASAVLGVAISYSTLYLFHISLVCLFLFYFIIIAKNNWTIIYNKPLTKYHYFFYFMFVWYSLTLIWSIDRSHTYNYLFYIFCGISISLVIIYHSWNIKNLNKIFKVLYTMFIVEIALSLLEMLTPFRLPVSPYSNYLGLFGRGLSSEDLVIPFNSNTPTGFQWNPNNLAVTLIIILPFFLLSKKLSVRLLGSITIITLVFGTGSRGNIIAMMLIFIVYMYFTKKKRALITGMLLPAVLVLISVIFYPYLANSDNKMINSINSSFNSLVTYVTPTDTYRDDSIGVRQILIERGIDGLHESYGLGVGGGASKAIGSGIVSGREISSMHNFWIEVLVEAGYIFFIIFICWYMKIVSSLYVISKRSTGAIRYYSSACFISLVGFVAGAISASSVIYVFPMWILIGFSISVINNYETSSKVHTAT